MFKHRTDFWTLWEKARVGCFKRIASKHVYYLGWNRSAAQVGCMRQVLGPGALGRPRGIGRRGRWDRGSGWGIHVKPWLILVNVWQKPLQYCEVISLQLIKKLTQWVVKDLLAMQEAREPWVGKIFQRRKWQPTPVFLPGKPHGQKSQAGYSAQDRKESDPVWRSD